MPPRPRLDPEQVRQTFDKEVCRDPNGASQRTAVVLGCSRQRVEQIVKQATQDRDPLDYQPPPFHEELALLRVPLPRRPAQLTLRDTALLTELLCLQPQVTQASANVQITQATPPLQMMERANVRCGGCDSPAPLLLAFEPWEFDAPGVVAACAWLLAGVLTAFVMSGWILGMAWWFVAVLALLTLPLWSLGWRMAVAWLDGAWASWRWWTVVVVGVMVVVYSGYWMAGR